MHRSRFGERARGGRRLRAGANAAVPGHKCSRLPPSPYPEPRSQTATRYARGPGGGGSFTHETFFSALLYIIVPVLEGARN
eukprot:4514335-Prymnesium_polylepis.2